MNKYEKEPFFIYNEEEYCEEDVIELIERFNNLPSKEEVYIIMSPGGGIGLSFSGKGTFYTSLEDGQKALKSKNEWSKSKGYGVYELITLSNGTINTIYGEGK